MSHDFGGLHLDRACLGNSSIPCGVNKGHWVVFSWQMGQSGGVTHVSGTLARIAGRLVSASTVSQTTYTCSLPKAVSE